MVVLKERRHVADPEPRPRFSRSGDRNLDRPGAEGVVQRRPTLQDGLVIESGIEGRNGGEERERLGMTADAQRALEVLRRANDVAQIETRSREQVVGGRAPRLRTADLTERDACGCVLTALQPTASLAIERRDAVAQSIQSLTRPPFTFPAGFLALGRSRIFRPLVFGFAFFVVAIADLLSVRARVNGRVGMIVDAPPESSSSVKTFSWTLFALVFALAS
jgi:hypothetical protein